MASGHVNRANRPNTWPLRPTPQSEDSPCQPGAVHTWPIASFHCDAQFDRYRGIADFREPSARPVTAYSEGSRENRKLQWLAPPASVCVLSRRMPRVA